MVRFVFALLLMQFFVLQQQFRLCWEALSGNDVQNVLIMVILTLAYMLYYRRMLQ